MDFNYDGTDPNLLKAAEDKDYADKTTANLLRAEFEDWEKTFKPIELQLMNELSFNNPSILSKTLNTAQKEAESSYRSMSDIIDRQNNALGINPTDQESATSKRLLNLNESLAVADAKNTTRSSTRQMDEALLMGTTPNPNVVKNTYQNQNTA